ncbi:kinase/pyrophosphorylase [Nocardioidaceae bacterium]|nr:kinase/pyrophosphorylase [Nocardioidaceae bacterium]
MTQARTPADGGNGSGHGPAVPVFFLSDSTGISAETMGNALLLQFPHRRFDRISIPFITSEEEAARVVEQIDAAVTDQVMPLAFTTAASNEVRAVLHTSRVPMVDFFDMHLNKVEEILGDEGMRKPARLHGVGDVKRYNNRMAAIEFTIEHDDGASIRSLDRADTILLAPSRCGKTPTSMYLALQHSLHVANYPLVDEDLDDNQLPRPVRDLDVPLFGLMTTAERLSRVRGERRANSTYASLEQCRWELRQAQRLYDTHGVTVIDSSTRSVEEMSAIIVQQLRRHSLDSDADGSVRTRNTSPHRTTTTGQSGPGLRRSHGRTS